MAGEFGILRPLVQRFADIPRPLLTGVVTDNSGWAATGVSHVQVKISDTLHQAIYRDGPQPAVGSTVQVYRLGAGIGDKWLALPLPTINSSFLLAVGYNSKVGGNYYTTPAGKTADDSDFLAILGMTSAGAWSKIADYPFSGTAWDTYIEPGSGSGSTFDRTAGHAMLVRSGSSLICWMIPDNGAKVGDLGVDGDWFSSAAPNAHRSTDQGATWTALSRTSVRWVDVASDGRVYVVHDDGQAISSSDDGGATWTTRLSSAASDGSRWIQTAADPVDPDGTVLLYSRAAMWLTTDTFATVSGPMGPGSFSLSSTNNPVTGIALARTPDGAASVFLAEVTNPTSLGGKLYRQADPFPGTGNFTSTGVAPGGNVQDHLMFVVGSDLYLGLADAWANPLRRSTDNGATWPVLLTGNEAVWSAFDNHGIGAVLAVSGVLYATNNATNTGLHWDGDLFATPMQDGPRLLTSTDGGATWTDATGDLLTTFGADYRYALCRNSLVLGSAP